MTPCKITRQRITGALSEVFTSPVTIQQLHQAGHSVMEVIATLSVSDLKAIKHEYATKDDVTEVEFEPEFP